MMNVQKGIVKYKDRTDIVCEYGIVGDNQYYFMPDGKLVNGNVIATTLLVEAIDPEIQHLNVGVIDMEGNVVIPFENKSIKPITPDYLLVEKARPTSLSVIASLSSRSDPLSATKLVTTAASKKESIMSKMGTDGKFVFNDQFSEASIYTNNGENILNGEYYSFIGLNNSNIYYSTNIVEDEVYEYSLLKNDVDIPIVDNSIDNDSPDSIDVNNVINQQEEIANTVNDALNNVDNSLDNDISTEEDNNINQSDDLDDSVDNNLNKEISEEDNDVNNNDDLDNVGNNLDKESSIADETIENNDILVSDSDNNVETVDIDNTTQEISSLENTEETDEITDTDEFVTSDDVQNIDDNVNSNDLDYSEDNIVDEIEDVNIFEDNSSNDLFKINTDNYIQKKNERVIPMKNDYYKNDSYDRSSYYGDGSSKGFEGDTIIKEVATTMTELIRQSRDQKNIINNLEGKNEMLDNKVINLESVVSKLEGQKQNLENRNEQMEEKINAQSNIIDRQKDEIEYLKTQLEGKKDLVRLLNDAQSVLRNDSNSYEREYSYRRVA